MSNITDWIKYELYPALYSCIDRAFPEHSFKPYPTEWRSKTYITGEPHKDRADKTVVTKKVPGRILEQGGDNFSLVDYVMKRDRVEFIEAVKTLAEVVGLQLPKGEFNQEVYQRYKDKATLLEECNSYFQRCLETTTYDQEIDKYKALYPLPTNCAEEDKDVWELNISLLNYSRGYLNQRGYKDEDIKAMELGYIPDQDSLFKHLHSKGFSQSLIDEVLPIKKDTRIGRSHSIVIPYRSGGEVKGFKFRIIEDSVSTSYYKPKYINSIGLDKISGFFNISALKGNKDLVIVEGELDSLSATVRGVENVVATGGSNINSEQVRDAIRRGATSFTLCFDTEENISHHFSHITEDERIAYEELKDLFAIEEDRHIISIGEKKENVKPKLSKEETNKKNIDRAIEIILSEGVNRIYIATLPSNEKGFKVDPDSFIRAEGIEAFKNVIAKALPYYEYRLQETINKYGKIEYNRLLQPKDIDNLLDEVVETASQIPDATDRDRYKKLFTSLPAIKELGISDESLSITVDRLTSTRDKEAQAKEFKKLLSEATQLQDKGETDKALDLLDSKVKEVKLKDKTTEFSSLLIPIKEDELRERQANKPESINSGYTIGGEPLLLPSGAISILTAPTSHGKTTFLINMALNIAQSNPDTETYLFSYEEDGDSILINTLNTYLDEEISSNNRRTLKDYFTTGSTEYVKSQNREYFTSTKDRFFRELIETRRLNIHYSSYNSDTLIEAIRYLHKHAKPGAIFIDYIQLLNLPEGKYKTYSRQEEIKEICIALKDVAVETGLPIILGAQFNREVVNQLKVHATKIGEAGDIERIANLIVGFWNNNFKPLATEGELNEISNKGVAPNTLYTTVLKNRGGKVGLEEILSFNGNTGKIKNSSKSGNTYF